MSFAACSFAVLQIAAIANGLAAWFTGDLLASTTDFSHSVNPSFPRSESTSDNGIWEVVLLAIFGLWVGLYLWHRYRKPGKRSQNDQEALFLQLCDLHNLSQAERQLLKQAAKSQDLDQPALAFVNPQILLDYAKASPSSQLEAQSVLDRLFGAGLIEEIVQTAGERGA